MNSLPTELIVRILEEADPLTARQVMLCCRRFRNIFVQFRDKIKKDRIADVVIAFGENGITLERRAVFDPEEHPTFTPWELDDISEQNKKVINKMKAEGLLDIFVLIEQHFEINRLTVTGSLCDKALKTLVRCMRNHGNIHLEFRNCQLTFTDTSLWNKFVSIVRPKSIHLILSEISCPTFFTPAIFKDGLQNLTFVEHHGHAFSGQEMTSEFNNLLQLEISIYAPAIKFDVETICSRIERCTQGKEREFLAIGFRPEDYGRLVQFINELPGSHPSGPMKHVIESKQASLCVDITKYNMSVIRLFHD